MTIESKTQKAEDTFAKFKADTGWTPRKIELFVAKNGNVIAYHTVKDDNGYTF